MIPASYVFKGYYHDHWEEPAAVHQTRAASSGRSGGTLIPRTWFSRPRLTGPSPASLIHT
jgi:hypothetical protein